MGTNYYLHVEVCPTCKRGHKEVHIGKSSGGWTFSFRGYAKPYDVPNITSYRQWLDYLRAELATGTAEIRDEYGDTMTLDEFMALVESKRNYELNHTLYCRQHHYEHARDNCWLDTEGHSFTGCEFS